jgi:hypothetical protein
MPGRTAHNVDDTESSERVTEAEGLTLFAGRFAFELRDALQSLGLEGCRIPRDRDLARSLHMRDAAIESGNQLEQFTNEWRRLQRHPLAPCRGVCDRETFQTSPQRVHRQ